MRKIRKETLKFIKALKSENSEIFFHRTEAFEKHRKKIRFLTMAGFTVIFDTDVPEGSAVEDA